MLTVAMGCSARTMLVVNFSSPQGSLAILTPLFICDWFGFVFAKVALFSVHRSTSVLGGKYIRNVGPLTGPLREVLRRCNQLRWLGIPARSRGNIASLSSVYANISVLATGDSFPKCLQELHIACNLAWTCRLSDLLNPSGRMKRLRLPCLCFEEELLWLPCISLEDDICCSRLDKVHKSVSTE